MADDSTDGRDEKLVDTLTEDADGRTVLRHLLGLPVRGRVAARIDRAIAAVGPEHISTILQRSLARIGQAANGGDDDV
jgi:hypothetical protein